MSSHLRIQTLVVLLFFQVSITQAAGSPVCIADHLSANDPKSSSRPIAKNTPCVNLFFPDNVATWSVDVVTERDWPEIDLKISAGGDSKGSDKPASQEQSIEMIRENIENKEMLFSRLEAEKKTCSRNKDKEAIEACEAQYSDDLNNLGAEIYYASRLLDEMELMVVVPPSNTCGSVALESDCSFRIDVQSLELGRGDKAVASVTFTVESDPDTKQEKTLNYYIPKKGEFRPGIGTMFIFSDSKDYFTRPSGDQFYVDSGGGSEVDLNLAVTATWVRFNPKWPQPFIGIGSDADDLSVFAGVAWTFHRGWSLNLGVAAHKENKLNPTFNEGMDFLIDNAVDSTVLVSDEYKFRPFVGLSWTQKADK